MTAFQVSETYAYAAGVLKDRDDDRKRARKTGDDDQGGPFRWRHLAEDGSSWHFTEPKNCADWTCQRTFVPPIYRQFEVMRAREGGQDPVIFWTEGERKADRLVALGLIALSGSNGAQSHKSLHADDLFFLQRARVVILPDQDEAGTDHANGMVNLLRSLACVACLSLPGLADREDVVDWLGWGGTAAELLRLAEVALADAPDPKAADPDAALSFDAFVNVELDPAPSLWGDGVLAKSSINVLAGDAGVGKTCWTVNLALAVATGRPFLGLAVEQAAVLFVEAEGNPDSFRARLRVAKDNVLGLDTPPPPIYFAPPGANYSIGSDRLRQEVERLSLASWFWTRSVSSTTATRTPRRTGKARLWRRSGPWPTRTVRRSCSCTICPSRARTVAEGIESGVPQR